MRQIKLWVKSASAKCATSDPDAPRYCVSLCGADGAEVRCLSTYALDDHADAWTLAKDEAQRRELPAVEIDRHGQELRRWGLMPA